MLQALEEIYEKIAGLKVGKVDLSSLSSEELKEIREKIKAIHQIGYELSQAIVNEETIRKLYSKDAKEGCGK